MSTTGAPPVRPPRRERLRGRVRGGLAPYLVDGTVRAGEGTEESLLATIRRPDGTRRVTYVGRLAPDGRLAR